MLHNFVLKKNSQNLPASTTLPCYGNRIGKTHLLKLVISSWQAWKYDDNQSILWYELVDLGALCSIFSRSSWTTLENGFRFNTIRAMKNTNNKNISYLKKKANLKKDAVSAIYPRFFDIS